MPEEEHASVGAVLGASKVIGVAELEGITTWHYKYLSALSTGFVVVTTAQ